MSITNQIINEHLFLSEMYEDAYFPTFLVDKCKDVLLELCLQIETNKPQTLEELYVLTHAATDKLNILDEEFHENNSEIETVARDWLGTEFAFIAKAYHFDNADQGELIATREW